MSFRPTLIALSVLVATPFVPRDVSGYPVDEYERTGIRRLKVQQEALLGVRKGRKLAPGAQWPGKYIELRMNKVGRNFELTKDTPKDPVLQAALEQVLKKWAWQRYNVALLDITDPAHPRFAGVNEHSPQTPGSVAKVLVASGLLEQLRQRFPNDIAARERMLKTHVVTADDWAMSDSHEVPVVTGDKLENVSNRRVRIGDSFTLWEWMDHALSPSNNSAAATLWREATLMKLLGQEYPPPKYGPELWTKLSKDALTEASFAVIDKPLLDAGLDPESLKLRLYFTRGAGKYIRSKSCDATSFGFVQWMLRVEQGRMVDEWASLELKKMLYLTRRRVRYLYTHTLDNFGAFFKSGSLYRFSPEAPRVQYEGDRVNVLNSLIEIDTSPLPPGIVPAATGAQAPSPATAGLSKPAARPHVYIVVVMSNELKRNAAMDHARLAEAIHAIVTATPDAPASIPTSPDAVKVPDIKKPSDEPDLDDAADSGN